MTVSRELAKRLREAAEFWKDWEGPSAQFREAADYLDLNAELLAALKVVVGLLRSDLETHFGNKIGAQIRAAIAKAEAAPAGMTERGSPTLACCALCGEPMPPGEEMFKFHGYSGPCPILGFATPGSEG